MATRMTTDERLDKLDEKIDRVNETLTEIKVSLATGAGRMKALEEKSHSPNECARAVEFNTIKLQTQGAARLGKGLWALIVAGGLGGVIAGIKAVAAFVVGK